MIFLTACGGNLRYKTELPEEPHPAMLDIVSHVVSNLKHYLFELDGTHVFSEKYGFPNENINYYTYTEEDLMAAYTNFFRINEGADFVQEVREEADEELFKEIQRPKEYSLPIIQLQEENVLTIETEFSKEEYDLTELLSEYDVKPTDELVFNVVAVTEDEFQIHINSFNNEESSWFEVSLFVKQDLSNLIVTQPFGEEFEQKLSEGQLADFENLFMELGSSGYLSKLFLGNIIWNEDTKELHRVDENDSLSENGEFVYLDGEDLAYRDDDDHYVQRIEDYLEGNNKYHSEFQLNYEELGEEIGIDSVGANMVKVKYLNERYAVLFIKFAGDFIGTTGSTNAIIDLKNDTVYLVDWDWS